MDVNTQSDLFEMLKKNIEEVFEVVDTQKSGTSQVGDGLKTLVAMTDESYPVIIDLAVIRPSEENSFLMFYATMFMDMEENARSEVEKATPSMNFLCPYGSFGVFKSTEMYYKQSILLDEEMPNDILCDDIMEAFAAVYSTVDAFYPISRQLALGQTTYDELLEKGILNTI